MAFRLGVFAWQTSAALAIFMAMSCFASDSEPDTLPQGQFHAAYFANIELSGEPTFENFEDRIDHNWRDGGPDALLPSNQFSGFWRGTFHFEAGTHRFEAVADDGVRVWVDGQLLIDAWLNQPATYYGKSVTLTAGQHLVEVAYYENEGQALLRVSWTREDDPGYCEAGEEQFCAEYYDNPQLAGFPRLRVLEPAIDHRWGFEGAARFLPSDYFSARWFGRFFFKAGIFKFQINADDGARLWVDDKLIIDAWHEQSETESTTELLLDEGVHAIKIEYFEAGGEAVAKLSWSPIDINTANLESPLGTNISELSYYSTEWPLLDVMKSSGGWYTQADGVWDSGEQAKLDLDEWGWVRSLPAREDAAAEVHFDSVAALVLNGNGGKYPAGRYTVLYEGEGTLVYEGDGRKDEALSSPGRDIIEVASPSNAGLVLRITATDPEGTGNYLRHIRVIMPGRLCNGDPFADCDQATGCGATSPCPSFEEIAATQMFHPRFLQDLRNFSVIRFMDLLRTNTSQVSKWEDRPRMEDVRWNGEDGAPLELALALTTKLNADPWLNLPVRADDNYVEQFARLVKDALTSRQKVYVEYGNEVWNTAFSAGSWVQAQGETHWPGTGHSGYTKRINWYGKRTAEIAAIWKRVWADQSDRLVFVMAGQAANPWVVAEALDCPLWSGEPGGAPCSTNINAIAIAPYFGAYLGFEEGAAGPRSWTSLEDGGLNTLFTELNGLGDSTSDGLALRKAFEQMTRHATLAQSRDLALVAYEGGQHLVGVGRLLEDAALRDLFIAANRDARMQAVYERYLTEWKRRGGTLFCHFLSVGAYTKWGSWGAKEYQTQSDAPKHQALIQFIEQNPCWWPGCQRAPQ